MVSGAKIDAQKKSIMKDVADVTSAFTGHSGMYRGFGSCVSSARHRVHSSHTHRLGLLQKRG